ncbi:Cyclic nucleotide phosphodiesterase [Trinorchestia longiramus]|nr:Cyclic nucleotide phosphodiesterase [Trinorchestia longiramus]
MGQGNSKETSQEPEKNKPYPRAVKVRTASPAVEATANSFRDAATPLSHKLINYFSPKSEGLIPNVASDHGKYSSASPLPPSSSLLAKGYREELGGISPAQQNRVSSSFFLGKVLISPRRPLRDGTESNQDLGSSATKDVADELSTPQALKRKASPENSSYSKKRRFDYTTSPSLKTDWKLLSKRAQVEEQDEDKETVEPIGNEGISENMTYNVDITENCAHNDAPVYDVEDQHIVTEHEEMEECEDESVRFNAEEIMPEESRLSAPYSPSQSTKNLMSMMNISLSSSGTCASPAPAYVPHNSIIEELDEDVASDLDADQGDEKEGNATLTQTIGKGLWLLKETLLGTDPKLSVSEESNDKQKSDDDSVFDTCEVGNDYESESTLGEPTTPNSEVIENGTTELNDDEAVRSPSEARSLSSLDENEQSSNNLPNAGTTHSSTVSKKMLRSECMVTKSQVPKKQESEDEENPKKYGGYDSSPVKAVLRSPSSEDSFYHHPLSLSTFSSSISRAKWPSFSLISTSAVSSLPVASIQFIKSIITSESLHFSTNNECAKAPTTSASYTLASTVKDILAGSLNITKDCSLTDAQENHLDLPATDDSTDTSLLQAEEDGNENIHLNHNEDCVLELLPDNSNDEVSESIENCEKENQSKGEQTPENRGKEVNSAILVPATTIPKPVSPDSVTPKRSSRIASIRSSHKAIGNNSPIGSKAGTSSDIGRRRRHRSSSSESNVSVHHASQESQAISDDSSSSKSGTKKQRLDKPSAAHPSPDSAATDHGEQVGELNKESSTPQSDSLSTEDKFKDIALLRDDASAQYARDNQLVVVVVRSSNSSSCDLSSELRLRFPLSSSINAAAKHTKKLRRTTSTGVGLKRLEQNVMQQTSPIIVEAAKGVTVGPHLLIAHSANYTSVLLHEAAFSSMLPYQPVRASLPFCYCWFLSLTDSVELNNVAQLLLRQLLAVPAIRSDLLARTKYRSAQEFVQSYIRNNTVGGPEILHCTAKGGTSASDVAYTARRDVLRALGQVSTLQVVGFVVTPRTFGARIKLDENQLTLWDNSDSPTVPQVIAAMFEEQKAHVSVIDDQAPAVDINGEDDSADDPNDILGYNADKKSLKFVSVDTAENDRFAPTSGLGSRAHITLGCNTQKVHPRTTGFDLLLALEMEKAYNEKSSKGIMEDANNVDISDKTGCEDGKERFSQSKEESQEKVVSSEPAENGATESEAELPNADADALTMSDIEEAMSMSVDSDGPDMKSTSVQLSDTEATPATDCLTFKVDGAVVRGYGEGVWVVYPEQPITVSAMFAGFHNAE